MLKISHAYCFALSLAISSQFTLEVYVPAKNGKKKSLKSPIFLGGGKEGVRSFKVVIVNTPKAGRKFLLR